MQTHVAITRTREGMYRVARFIAWVMTIVTFLAIIGHGFSDEANMHTTMILIAVLSASVGTLLFLPSSLHLRYQKPVAATLLIAGILACVLF